MQKGMRRKSDGYTSEKAKILSEVEMMKFLIETDDHMWLLEKVVLGQLLPTTDKPRITLFLG